MSKHYVYETGTELNLDTGVLIGSASEYYIKYKNPAGVVGSFSATLYSSYSQLAGAIGTYFLQRVLAYTDLPIPGEWRFQSYVGAVDGTWLGETAKLTIYDNFE